MERERHRTSAFLPMDQRATEILPRLRRTAEVVTAAFLRYGFSVNFSVGNTEAMVFYFGAGSLKLRRHVELELSSVSASRPTSGSPSAC